MAPVDTSRSDPRSRGGGLDQKRSKPKPRLDVSEPPLGTCLIVNYLSACLFMLILRTCQT
jgi:hypothetical protein